MATQGQTLFNVSGDDGAYTGNNRVDESYPAEDIHLTAVGGTALTTNGPGGSWQSEVAWNDDGGGSGGGPADDGTGYFAIPSWQTPVDQFVQWWFHHAAQCAGRSLAGGLRQLRLLRPR